MNFYDFNGMGEENCNNNNDFKSKLNDYTSKSESELMDELSKVAQKMREDGTFDADMLERLYTTASPMLNQMQRERMRNIIDALKG